MKIPRRGFMAGVLGMLGFRPGPIIDPIRSPVEPRCAPAVVRSDWAARSFGGVFGEGKVVFVNCRLVVDEAMAKAGDTVWVKKNDNG